MARKADPAVQYRNLDSAMSKLSREEQLVWIAQFLGQYDSRSLIIGGVLDCLEYYRKDVFDPAHTYRVDGSPMTSPEIIELARKPSLEESLRHLKEEGYTVEDYDTSVGEEAPGTSGDAGGSEPGPEPPSVWSSRSPDLRGWPNPLQRRHG